MKCILYVFRINKYVFREVVKIYKFLRSKPMISGNTKFKENDSTQGITNSKISSRAIKATNTNKLEGGKEKECQAVTEAVGEGDEQSLFNGYRLEGEKVQRWMVVTATQQCEQCP